MSSEFGFLVYCLHIHTRRDTNTDENVVVVVVAGDDSLGDARATARRHGRDDARDGGVLRATRAGV